MSNGVPISFNCRLLNMREQHPNWQRAKPHLWPPRMIMDCLTASASCFPLFHLLLPVRLSFHQGNVKFHTADICDSEIVAPKPGRRATIPSGAGRLRAVTLTDGTRIENVHHIVNATGYKTIWPFLASEGVAEHCTKDRYR